MSNMEAFNKIMSEIGEKLNEETITAIKSLLEAKDEPIAWLVWGHKKFPSLTFTKPADKYLFFSLYIAPPQRMWEGLTDEEIMDLWKQVYEPGHQLHVLAKFLAREVEAKLKEKNS